MRKLLLLCIFITVVGCSSDSGAYKKSSEVENLLSKSLPKNWVEMNSEGTDYALINNKSKSLFLFNSACRKYEGSTLNALTSSILTGIDELKIISRSNITIQNREAQEVIVSGKLDGVLRFLKISTVQKNNCIYDYVLISTNEKNLSKDKMDFETFINRIILN